MPGSPRPGVIPMLCERFEFRPAWTDRTMVEQLLDGVRGSTSHGLDPADYHLQAISSRLPAGDWESADPVARAELELLLVERFINWRAFSITFFFLWTGLPLEAVVVWLAVTYTTVIVFEVVKSVRWVPAERHRG